jgi:hypothetical protein
VHSDPLSSNDESPYQLDTFILKMKEGTGTAGIAIASSTYSTSAGWVKLTAHTSSNVLQIDPDRLPTDPVLELVIDCTASRPGTVLLVQPELRFHPDGY